MTRVAKTDVPAASTSHRAAPETLRHPGAPSRASLPRVRHRRRHARRRRPRHTVHEHRGQRIRRVSIDLRRAGGHLRPGDARHRGGAGRSRAVGRGLSPALVRKAMRDTFPEVTGRRARRTLYAACPLTSWNGPPSAGQPRARHLLHSLGRHGRPSRRRSIRRSHARSVALRIPNVSTSVNARYVTPASSRHPATIHPPSSALSPRCRAA